MSAQRLKDLLKEKKKTKVLFYIDPDLLKELDSLRKEIEITRSKILEHCIQNFITEEKKRSGLK